MDKLKKALSGDDEEEEKGIVTQVCTVLSVPGRLALNSGPYDGFLFYVII